MPVPTRRFGKTELQMPVLTCGGMRYQHSWKDDEKIRGAIPDENQQNLETTIRYGLELGINHIETARGYGTSEFQLGKFLPSIPRDQIIVQTKITPKDDPAELLRQFEISRNNLQLETIDLFSIHGVSDEKTLEQAKICYPVLEQLKKEGRIRHIGFSTHGPPELVIKAINTGLFEYINLHWYFVHHPMNRAPVDAAAAQDMGVFIISPSDKGGKLYEPPPKLIEACRPLTPMAFNDLFCLRDPAVHTLSIGAARPSDLAAHVTTVQGLENPDETFPMVGKIEEQLFQTLENALGAEWVRHWHEGLPSWNDTPGEINIPEILRLWTFAKGLDMVEFGKMRYNMMGDAGHWAPGQKAGHVDAEALKPVLENSPFADEIPGILREAHALLKGEQGKRLSDT